LQAAGSMTGLDAKPDRFAKVYNNALPLVLEAVLTIQLVAASLVLVCMILDLVFRIGWRYRSTDPLLLFFCIFIIYFIRNFARSAQNFGKINVDLLDTTLIFLTIAFFLGFRRTRRGRWRDCILV
jgi:hypothetical protein